MNLIKPETIHQYPFVHPDAVIDKSAFVHPTAVIGPNVSIGEDVYIGPYCVIGMPAEWKGKEDINAGVVIFSGVRLTGLVTVDSGVDSPTVIGFKSYLMKHCHVGHDAVIGNNVIISCGVKIGGHAIIKHDCNIGLNAVIHQKQVIEQGCMIGMGSVITRKLVTNPNRKYAGNPAKDIGSNHDR